MSLRRTVWTIVVALTLPNAGCMVSRTRPYTIPAHWTGSTDRVEPVVEDFCFEEMDFFAPNEGWIVGCRFLLHVRDDELTRTFVDPEDASLRTVDFLSPDDGWAGGHRFADSGLGEGVIWHYQNGKWLPVDLTPLGMVGWSVETIRFASPNEGWALGLRDFDVDPHGSVVLRYDGKTWSVDPYPRADGRQWMLIDMCVDASGNGWAVGKQRDGDQGWRPLIAAVRGGTWHASTLPDSDIATGVLNRVACLPGGKAMASGLSGTIFRGVGTLFAYDGSWKRVELPEALRHLHIQALAALSLDDFWLALSRPGSRPLIMHFTGGTWIEVPRPVVPHGGLQDYGVGEIQFISADEGWAIGNDVHGPGLIRGLVLHYKDGVWRNRNWNWHFWDERWFGLLGR